MTPAETLNQYCVWYWDTFEPPGEDTYLLARRDTLEAAKAYVLEEYGDRIKPTGADQVEIVYNGNVIERYPVA